MQPYSATWASLNRAFGWNVRAWSTPFTRAIADVSLPETYSVLELGAGPRSVLSVLFASPDAELHVTAYPSEQYEMVNSYLNSQPRLEGILTISPMSALAVTGRYNLILMKSVAGGLFRTDSSTISDVQEFYKKLRHEHLLPGGFLVTLDNGSTVFETLLRYFGARKNNWRFFRPEDFQDHNSQYCFGWLSTFSFRTRLGDQLGQPLEDLLYYADRARWKISPPRRPSVIVTVFAAPPAK